MHYALTISKDSKSLRVVVQGDSPREAALKALAIAVRLGLSNGRVVTRYKTTEPLTTNPQLNTISTLVRKDKT